MAITLPDDTTKRLVASIKRYVAENLDQEIGDLQAGLFLEFALKEIGPSVYNHAIGEARDFFEARVGDLEGACFEREFAYWQQPPSRKAK